jgi:2-polyprenyl-3-methyl-5-hydroxy-6-metoxy-1,4-benzoquinol methylase
MSQHPLEIDPIISGWLPNLSGMRVLDLGCGKGSLGLLLRQAPGGLHAHLTGAEIFQPNIDFVRRFNLYDEIFEGDISTKDQWPDFDVVVACEILEHLPREAAEQLLARIEEHTQTVIVSTPNGRDLRGPIGGNPAEAHLSVWTVADFKTRGYEVKGVGSLLHRGSRRSVLTAAAWHASTPFAHRVPRIAGNLVARRVL